MSSTKDDGLAARVRELIERLGIVPSPPSPPDDAPTSPPHWSDDDEEEDEG